MTVIIGGLTLLIVAEIKVTLAYPKNRMMGSSQRPNFSKISLNLLNLL